MNRYLQSSRLIRFLSMSLPLQTATKHLWIVRHGQALHNPRAEAAKDAGCSFDEFLELMRQDDCLDADLTDLGRQQANAVSERLSLVPFDAVVSSPLSRAIETADLAYPPTTTRMTAHKRMIVEDFREINGYLLNAQRRSKTELHNRFPAWDLSELQTEEDSLWTDELEQQMDAAERGYKGLLWIAGRPETNILLACHGGILKYSMTQHPLIRMVDGRSNSSGSSKVDGTDRPVGGRFGNCEVRRYTISTEPETTTSTPSQTTVVLTEVDL